MAAFALSHHVGAGWPRVGFDPGASHAQSGSRSGAAAISAAIGLCSSLVHLLARFSGESALPIGFLAIGLVLATTLLVGVVAHAVGASGVLAVATTGIYLGRREARFFSAAIRLQANGVWDILVFLLNSVLFVLLGFQLRAILGLDSRLSMLHLIGAGLLVALVVMVVRMAWVFPGAWLAWKLGEALTHHALRHPQANQTAMTGWMGMRGVVSLAAALALPDATPDRAAILFCTFAVILMTLLVQGLAIPAVARVLQLGDDNHAEVERALARQAMARAALDQLDTLAEAQPEDAQRFDHLRHHYAERLTNVIDQQGNAPLVSPKVARVQRALLAAERDALIHLRDQNQISDEILHEFQRELDFAEVNTRRA